MALHHLVVLLRLLPLLLGGLLTTSHAAETETHRVLVGHALDDGIAQGEDVGPEVIGPALLLVTLKPGKETIETKE